MIYAGIGSRNTPNEILDLMKRISRTLSDRGYTLRSGGAIGADQAFAKMAKKSEIFRSLDASEEAIELSLNYHPNPEAVKKKGKYVKGLMGRNMHILLGKYLDRPVDFVICWTPGGRIEGGTGQALRYCKEHSIKVYNLAIKKDIEDLRERFGKNVRRNISSIYKDMQAINKRKSSL